MLQDHFRYLTTPERYGGLDALRAAAIGLVISYHFQMLPFGWIGVDLFFVLSGFLIGGMICRKLEHATFSFLEFYWHRALRILPTYFAAVGCLCLIEGYRPPLAGLVAVLGLFHSTASYFFGVATPMAPHGSWSLVIEEHFYLLAPIVMSLACLLRGRHGIISASLIAIIAGPLVRLWMSSGFPADDPNWYFASFVQFHSRFDELAAGVLVAAILPFIRLGRVGKEMLIVGSSAALAAFVLMLWGKDYLLHPQMLTRETIWVPSLLAFVFGSWVFLLRDMPLASPFVTATARLAYPLYLFHFFLLFVPGIFPDFWLFAIPRNALGLYGNFLFCIGLSYVTAYLVSLLIEFPFLRVYKPHLGRHTA